MRGSRPEALAVERREWRSDSREPRRQDVVGSRRVAILIAGAALIEILAQVPTAQAQSAGSVTRGPYLQMGTPRSVVVRWRTNIETDSRVTYGPLTGPMHWIAGAATPTREHEVTLQGLSPATRYRYVVGTSTQVLAGGGAGFAFATSPVTG